MSSASSRCIHFFIQSKLDVWEPTWMAGFYFWLMGWRGLDWLAPRGRTAPLWQVALLGLVATIATGLGEALYFHLAFHAPLVRVIAANFSLDGRRPPVLGRAGRIEPCHARRYHPRTEARQRPARAFART